MGQSVCRAHPADFTTTNKIQGPRLLRAGFLASTEHASASTRAASGPDVKPPDGELRRTPYMRSSTSENSSETVWKSGRGKSMTYAPEHGKVLFDRSMTAQEEEVVTVEVGPTAKLIDDGQAVQVRVKVTCEAPAQVLEAAVFAQ